MREHQERHSPACPYCGARRSRVLHTESHHLYSAVARLRRCQECWQTWTTDELPDLERKTRPEESPDQ